MNKTVDNYLVEGCGRCPLGGTPDCKVHRWLKELEYLRHLILDCNLTEECKWGVPCYTFQGANLLILSAFKEYCAVSFFKGSLLLDEANLLDRPGENSQAARLFKFTDLNQIQELDSEIRAYIFEAIEVEKAGLKVEFKKRNEPIPIEFQSRLDEDPALSAAFEALTPGRQRGYIIYFSAPKQSKTRSSRVEKLIPKIMSGKGFHDR